VLLQQPELAPLYKDANDNIFEVVKMQNFSNCKERRGIHFGVSGLEHFEPGDNKMGNFMSVSAMYLLSGKISSLSNNFQIRKIRHEI
jgi:hypothetical protein